MSNEKKMTDYDIQEIWGVVESYSNGQPDGKLYHCTTDSGNFDFWTDGQGNLINVTPSVIDPIDPLKQEACKRCKKGDSYGTRACTTMSSRSRLSYGNGKAAMSHQTSSTSSLTCRYWHVLRYKNADDEYIQGAILITPRDLEAATDLARQVLITHDQVALIAIHVYDREYPTLETHPIKTVSLDDEDVTECKPRSRRTR